MEQNRVLFAGVAITILFVEIFTDFLNLFPKNLEVISHYSQQENNIYCYHDYESDDILPSADRDFSPAAQSIFFHETSCRRRLSVRQGCAVEAAARAHPVWEVHVTFAAPIDAYIGPMKTLQLFTNIKYSRFHIFDYAKGTPLESFISNGGLNKSRWPMIDTADMMRYITLYKFGGIYLDLDSYVVKPLTSLKKNWSARESNETVAAGALCFSKDDLGRTVAEKILRGMASNFTTDRWAFNSVGILTQTLKQICSTQVVEEMTAANCAGFEVYEPKMFYPIRWSNGTYYFRPGIMNFPEAYMIHVWSTKTRNIPVRNDSRYAYMVKRVCPTMYQTYPEQFGFI